MNFFSNSKKNIREVKKYVLQSKQIRFSDAFNMCFGEITFDGLVFKLTTKVLSLIPPKPRQAAWIINWFI